MTRVGSRARFRPADLVVVVLPLVLVFVPVVSLNHPNAGLRVAHKEYWLAPARQADTIESLRQHMARFGSVLVVFLSYIHWLVLRANTLVPPKLPAPWAISGIVAFVIAALIWTRALLHAECDRRPSPRRPSAQAAAAVRRL